MAPNHKYRQSFENHNAVSLIFYRQTGPGNIPVWYGVMRRGETPPVLLITNVMAQWKVKLPSPPPLTCWWSDKTISLSKWQLAGLKNKLKFFIPGRPASTTDRGQDDLIIIQRRGWSLSKLKVLLQCSSLTQYLLPTTTFITKTTYIWYRFYNILKH